MAATKERSISVRIGVAAASVALLSGCGSAGAGEGTSPQQERLTANAVKERTTDCTGPQLKDLLDTFASAFSAGKIEKAEALIAKEPFFQWYGSNHPGERVGEEAIDRASLGAYFRERHAEHDRLRFTDFRFNRNSGGYGNFQFKQVRSADDLAAGIVTRPGKGAAVCFGHVSRIAVLNL